MANGAVRTVEGGKVTVRTGGGRRKMSSAVGEAVAVVVVVEGGGEVEGGRMEGYIEGEFMRRRWRRKTSSICSLIHSSGFLDGSVFNMYI